MHYLVSPIPQAGHFSLQTNDTIKERKQKKKKFYVLFSFFFSEKQISVLGLQTSGMRVYHMQKPLLPHF